MCNPFCAKRWYILRVCAICFGIFILSILRDLLNLHQFTEFAKCTNFPLILRVTHLLHLLDLAYLLINYMPARRESISRGTTFHNKAIREEKEK